MRLLDTTLLVDFIRRREEARRLVQRMEDEGERIATTEVNAFELLLGAYAEGRVDQVRFAEIQGLLQRMEVLALDRGGAIRAAQVLSALRAEGKDIGVLDALIAGISLASGYDTIVTRDEGFRRVPGLKTQGY